MMKEGHYNRQSKRSRATNQGSKGNGPHHGRRRPSLENLVLLATFQLHSWVVKDEGRLEGVAPQTGEDCLLAPNNQKRGRGCNHEI